MALLCLNFQYTLLPYFLINLLYIHQNLNIVYQKTSISLQRTSQLVNYWTSLVSNPSIFPPYCSVVKSILNSSASKQIYGKMDSPLAVTFCKPKYGLSTNCDHSSTIFTDYKSLNSVLCSNIFYCFESVVLWPNYSYFNGIHQHG